MGLFYRGIFCLQFKYSKLNWQLDSFKKDILVELKKIFINNGSLLPKNILSGFSVQQIKLADKSFCLRTGRD